jgi:hypothetical protein
LFLVGIIFIEREDLVMKKLAVLLMVLFMFVVAFNAVATETLSGNKITDGERPVIDGKLDDQVWQRIKPIEAYFLDESTKQPIQGLTRIWLTYSDFAIFVALEAVKNGQEPITRETQDDAWAITHDDTLAMSFNGYRTLEGHLDFWFANPGGAKKANFSQGKADKPEWSDWLVKSGRTQDGWCLEMQIPWQLINLPKRQGKMVVWTNFDRRDDGRPAYWQWGGKDDPAANWAEWEIELTPVEGK